MLGLSCLETIKLIKERDIVLEMFQLVRSCHIVVVDAFGNAIDGKGPIGSKA